MKVQLPSVQPHRCDPGMFVCKALKKQILQMKTATFCVELRGRVRSECMETIMGSQRGNACVYRVRGKGDMMGGIGQN